MIWAYSVTDVIMIMLMLVRPTILSQSSLIYVGSIINGWHLTTLWQNQFSGIYHGLPYCEMIWTSGQMRSLRIFYSDDACTNGQLVIASRESQYKILHFHNGGLDRLAETLADWKFLAQPKRKVRIVEHSEM